VPTRLDDLERQFGDLATELSDQDATLAEIDGRATEIAAIIAGVDEHLADVDAAASARAAALGNQLEVSRVIDLTARARLFLYQANYGLAIDDLVVAKAILDAIDPTSGGITSEIRDAASARLALSLASLPDRPVLAADDLNVAWQLLVDDTADPAVASLPPVPPLASEQPAAVDTDVVAPVDVVAPAGDGTPAADEATTGDATADG